MCSESCQKQEENDFEKYSLPVRSVLWQLWQVLNVPISAVIFSIIYYCADTIDRALMIPVLFDNDGITVGAKVYEGQHNKCQPPDNTTSVQTRKSRDCHQASPLNPPPGNRSNTKNQKTVDAHDAMTEQNRPGQPSTVEDPGPKDGTNIRHMLVFVDSPASLFVIYMLLAKDYPDATVDLLNASCTEASRNLIIVTSYALSACGLNLQRANYCIVMEVASISSMLAVIVALQSKENLVELLRMRRRYNHDALNNFRNEGIPWDFLTSAT
ncbi:hypothetical protein CHU98_g5603 [Xylaria longipes]|nr:hypothetical protein CHU98_g5603 [Xylaria longipes]